VTYFAVRRETHGMSGSGTKLPFAAVQNYVCFLGYSGREMLAVRLSHFDPREVIGTFTRLAKFQWILVAQIVQEGVV
jgi:hypothetical protein